MFDIRFISSIFSRTNVRQGDPSGASYSATSFAVRSTANGVRSSCATAVMNFFRCLNSSRVGTRVICAAITPVSVEKITIPIRIMRLI